VGSIPIARSIKPIDAVGFTGFHPSFCTQMSLILDAVGRGFSVLIVNWTRLEGTSCMSNDAAWAEACALTGLGTQPKIAA
jgi:hypothetical protein